MKPRERIMSLLRKYNPWLAKRPMKYAKKGELTAEIMAENIDEWQNSPEEYRTRDSIIQDYVTGREVKRKQAQADGKKVAKDSGLPLLFFMLWNEGAFRQAINSSVRPTLARIQRCMLLMLCTSDIPFSIHYGRLCEMAWASYDTMWVYYACTYTMYLLTTPIELGVLIALTCIQIGAAAAFISMIPLFVCTVAKLLLVRFAFKEQQRSRTLQAERFNILDESIQANKVIKFQNMEKDQISKMEKLRQDEEKKLRFYISSNASSLWVQLFLAPMMAWLSVYVVDAFTGSVTTTQIMTCFGYFRSMAGFAIFKLVDALQNVTIGVNACSRHYNLFAASAKLEGDGNVAKEDDNSLIEVNDANFSWSVSGDTSLYDITLTLPREKLIGVCGPMGAGKSSLLLAMLGEMDNTSGTFKRHPVWNKKVAYVPQNYWLLTGTVRTNLTFAKLAEEDVPYANSKKWIDTVVDACGFRKDIESFEDGLDHFIGEGGVSLSGGQRARLQLTRAVYSNADITILDDPIAALDPKLQEQVFDAVIARGGILHGTGRSVILVSTNPAHLARCDEVVVVQDGKVTAQGSPDLLSNLIRTVTAVNTTKKTFEQLPTLKAQKSKKKRALGDQVGAKTVNKRQEEAAWTDLLAGDTMFCASADGVDQTITRQELTRWVPESNEDEDEGNLDVAAKSLKILLDEHKTLISGVDVPPRSYYKSLIYTLGFRGLFLGGAFIVTAQGCVYAWQYLLKDWLGVTNPDYKAVADDLGYMLIPIIVLGFLGAAIHYFSYLAGSTWIQNKCGRTIMYAPYSFFAVNSAGRMYGNISQDSQMMERNLSIYMGVIWVVSSQVMGTVVLTCISLPYMLGLFVPLAFVYRSAQRKYSLCLKPVTHLEAATRGPVQSHIAASFYGLAVIRAFQQKDQMKSIQDRNVRHFMGCSQGQDSLTAWLSFWADVIIYNCILTTSVILLATLLDADKNSLGPTVLSNLMSLSGVIGQAALLIAMVEMALMALQRLVRYSDLPHELDIVRKRPLPDDEKVEPSKKRRRVLPCFKLSSTTSTAGTKEGDASPSSSEADISKVDSLESGTIKVSLPPIEPPKNWPGFGALEFRQTYASYKWDLPPALKDFTLTIPAGSSCAFVGRSGSGKSTAFLAVMGMLPITGGVIEVDGIDISRVDLKTLRDAIAVVPQEPVLFTGTLRSNLDPHRTQNDDTIWEVIRAVRLEDLIHELGGLDIDPKEVGLSSGQTQLLCLARAFIRNTNILMLDEANSSVDPDTEKLMNEIVSQFCEGKIVIGGVSRKRTVVEIAHRLSGVLKRDKVVVLSFGQMIEIGVPAELAKDKSSSFASMLAAQGVTK